MKISISLPEGLIEQVEEYAEEEDLKRSQVVQRALKQYFKEPQEEGEGEGQDLSYIEEEIAQIKKTLKKVLKKLGIDVNPKVKEDEEIIDEEETEEEDEEDPDEEVWGDWELDGEEDKE